MSTMSEPANVLVAIPAYNAGKTLERVLQEVYGHVSRDHVLVVNDGSQDNTADCAVLCGAKLLNHKKNRGKGAALKTAFEQVLNESFAQGVITLDADGQHSPAEIPKFLHVFAQSGSDLIIGARNFSIREMPLLRVISNTLTSKLLSWKTKQSLKDSQSGYRLYSRRLVQSLKLKTAGYETESEIILQAARSNMRISFVPIETIYNGEASHISGLRDITRFIKLFFAN